VAGVVVELTGDEAKLLASMQKVIAQNAKTGDSFKNTGAKAKEAADVAVKEQQRVERENKKAADAIYAEHKKMLDSKAGESRRAGLAEEALARKTAFAEVNSAISAAEKEIKEAEKILAAKKKLAAEEVNVANGPLDALKNTVTVAGAIATAVGVATKAWGLYKEAQDSALGSLEGLDPANRKLAQVATNADDLNKMQTRADAASLATGVPRAQAREVLFNARSEGYESSFEAILASNSVVDPNASAKVAGKLPAIFKNKIGPMESISLALKGANESNLDFEQMANTLAIAGEGGSVLGSSPEETTAIAATLSARFKSGDVAADRMKGFGVKAGIDPRFAGSGFIESHRRLSEMPEAERKDFLGESQELNTFYVAMTEDLAKIKDQLAKATQERKDFSEGGGELRTKLANANNVESIATNKQVRISRIGKEIATEKNLAQSAANDEIASKNAMANVEENKGSIVNRFATNLTSLGLRMLGDGVSPSTKTTVANQVGDMAHQKTFGVLGLGFDVNSVLKTPNKAEIGRKSIEDSFKADAGKGPADSVVSNAGLIKSIEADRDKLKPKLTEFQDKERITEAEQVQIRSAEFQLLKKQELASKLGNRNDLKSNGIRMDVDVAKARLNTVRENATLSPQEAQEYATTKAKDSQYESRIEDLRRQDAERLQKTTEKTNDLLTSIDQKLNQSNTPPDANAIRAQVQQGRQ